MSLPTRRELAEWRATISNATPAPWQADFGGFHFSSIANGYEDIGECADQRNGYAIVTAMNSMPRLLALVERLLPCAEDLLDPDIDQDGLHERARAILAEVDRHE